MLNLSATQTAGSPSGSGLSFGLSFGRNATGTALIGAVTLLRTTATDANSLTLAWSAPAGSPTDYAVDYRLLYGAGWTSVTRTPSTTTTQAVTGLAFSTAYEFRVRALIGAVAGTAASLIAATGASAAFGLTTFGDSVTAGSLATTNANRWANLTAGYRGLTLNNKGVSGTVLQNSNDSSAAPRANNGRDRFVADIQNIANRGDFLISQYGLNDLRYTAAPTTLNLANFIVDYREILNGLLSGDTYSAIHPARIFLGSPSWIPDAGYTNGTTGFTGSDRTVHENFVAAVAALAVEYGVGYADIYGAMRDGGGAALMDPDTIHPTDSGHAVIAVAYQSAVRFPTTAKLCNVLPPWSHDANIVVTWEAPQQGGSVTNYDVEYGVRGAFTMGNTATTSGLTYTFTGVATGSCVVRVRANFADGSTGPWSFGKSAVQVVNGSAFAAGTITGQGHVWGLAPAADLATHTTTSGTWTRSANSTSGQTLVGTIYNAARLGASGNSIAFYNLASASLGNGVFSEATFRVRAASSNYNCAVVVRETSTGGVNCLMAIYNNTNVRILKTINGTATTLATFVVVFASNTDFKLRLEASNGSQKVFLDGVLVASSTEPESNLTTLGTNMGIRLQQTTTSMTDTAGTHVVSAKVGTLT